MQRRNLTEAQTEYTTWSVSPVYLFPYCLEWCSVYRWIPRVRLCSLLLSKTPDAVLAHMTRSDSAGWHSTLRPTLYQMNSFPPLAKQITLTYNSSHIFVTVFATTAELLETESSRSSWRITKMIWNRDFMSNGKFIWQKKYFLAILTNL